MIHRKHNLIKGRGNLAMVIYIAVLMIFATLIYFSCTYLYFCMAIFLWFLPSVAMLLLYDDYRGSAVVCIFNFIAMMQYLMQITQSYDVETKITTLLLDERVWLLIYGTSFIALALYILIPRIYLLFFAMYFKSKKTRVENALLELEAEWDTFA